MNTRPSTPQLAIVTPCFNESEVLDSTAHTLDTLIHSLMVEGLISDSSFLLLIDDGSSDDTWKKIENWVQQKKAIKGIKLTRNFGHQSALIAGMQNVEGADIIISIDADLQDDINAIREMILEYNIGAEIVYGVRNDRSSDSVFKRKTALLFYKILSLMGVESVPNHADFRLMSKRALQAFNEFGERNLYLRGMMPMIGFKTAKVYYARKERLAGESKYNFAKMLSLAWNGITNLSIQPLRFVTFCGFVIFFISIILSGYALYAYIFSRTIPGWSSIVLPMYFLGGVQLLCIGLLGEYVAKIYKEVKHRPLYFIEEKIG